MDANAKGTTAGLELLLNIVAMLLVLVALVYLANAILGLLPEIGGARISLQRLLGYFAGNAYTRIEHEAGRVVAIVVACVVVVGVIVWRVRRRRRS